MVLYWWLSGFNYTLVLRLLRSFTNRTIRSSGSLRLMCSINHNDGNLAPTFAGMPWAPEYISLCAKSYTPQYSTVGSLILLALDRSSLLHRRCSRCLATTTLSVKETLQIGSSTASRQAISTQQGHRPRHHDRINDLWTSIDHHARGLTWCRRLDL